MSVCNTPPLGHAEASCSQFMQSPIYVPLVMTFGIPKPEENSLFFHTLAVAGREVPSPDA